MRHLKFVGLSLLWLGLFFWIGFYNHGVDAGVHAAIISYAIPFGGLWCCLLVAYEPI